MNLSSVTDPDATLVRHLHELYHDASKHAVYQSVPPFMARALGYQEEIQSLWRSDAPRYDYVAARLALPPGAAVADIGANTGFFSLSLAHDRPDVPIAAYELNPRHAEYVARAAAAFSLGVSVRSQSCDLAGVAQLPVCDTVFLLNVLHHAGFDFDRDLPDDNSAFESYAIEYLARLRRRARQMVFQIGSNRGGDKGRPLFPRDDDAQRLGWIARVLHAAGWQIVRLSYANLEAGVIQFLDAGPEILAAAQACRTEASAVATRLSELGLKRFPGEFHRRPLVIASAGAV